MGLVFVVYVNIDKITYYVKDLFHKDNEIIIKEANPYKREYNFQKFSTEEDFIPYDYEDLLNIYFNILNNGWEEFNFYCTKEYKSCVSDTKTLVANDEIMSHINNYVNPFNSFEVIKTTPFNDGTMHVEVKYNYDSSKINEINNKIDSVLNLLDINSLESDYEKIEKIHNYIIDNTTYDNEAVDNNVLDTYPAYKSLILGSSVCSGYSDAMALFLDRLNIPNIKVSSEKHVWNLVYLDSSWLHLDLTWDDTENPKYNDNYFLITKEKLFSLDTKGHNFDEDFYIEAR